MGAAQARRRTLNPAILFAAAQRELDAARDACPHWDYEGDGEGAACCDRVEAALQEYRRRRPKPR